MFRAESCSSSGGQIVLLQHVVSSFSVNRRLQRMTFKLVIEISLPVICHICSH